MFVVTSETTRMCKQATAAGLVAVSLFAANSPASASDSDRQPVTITTDCRYYHPGVLGASGDCEIEKNKLIHRENSRLIRQEKTLADEGKKLADEGKKVGTQLERIDKENQEAVLKINKQKLQNACYDKLNADIDAIKSSRSLTLAEKSRFKAEITRCDQIPGAEGR